MADAGPAPVRLGREREIVFGALFCAFGVAAPVLFHAIPRAGPVLLPMHLPVLVAGLLLSPAVAVTVGVATPWASFLATGMPPFPLPLPMSLELAVLAGTAAVLTRAGVSAWLAVPATVLARVAATFVLYGWLGQWLGLPGQAGGWMVVAAGLPGAALQLAFGPPLAGMCRTAIRSRLPG